MTEVLAKRWELVKGRMVETSEGEFFHARDVLQALAEHSRTNIQPRKRDRALYRRFGFWRVRYGK